MKRFGKIKLSNIIHVGDSFIGWDVNGKAWEYDDMSSTPYWVAQPILDMIAGCDCPCDGCDCERHYKKAVERSDW